MAGILIGATDRAREPDSSNRLQIGQTFSRLLLESLTLNCIRVCRPGYGEYFKETPLTGHCAIRHRLSCDLPIYVLDNRAVSRRKVTVFMQISVPLENDQMN